MILFICSKETDYLQDLTYSGLASLCGKGKVVDFPYHWPYHKQRKLFWASPLEYPMNLGFTPGPRPSQLRDCSLAVLACAKPDALESFKGWIEKLRVPWVFLDGGDRTEIGGDFRRTGGEKTYADFLGLVKNRPPALIFKRELPLGFSRESVFPFPFSFKRSLLEGVDRPLKKTRQVVFWAVESSRTRKKAFDLLKGLYDCDENGSASGQKFRKYPLKGKKYFQALSSAKISLSLRGEGFDTLRYWEIPACGSLLISEAPAIQIPDNFQDGRHAVFCRPDLSDLLQKIDYYLERGREREEIAEAGRKHLLARHTTEARAEFFIEKVREKLGIDLMSS